MSSLQRYKKSGGFLQLLMLIETFGPQKKEKFLEMIENENPAWAKALRAKMLTIERIFSWSDDAVSEIFKQMTPKSVAFALQGLKDEQKQKVMKFMSHAEQRRLDDVLTESKPTPDEIASTLVKVVEQTRKMLNGREISADKVDAELQIPQDFEARLGEQGIAAIAHSMAGDHSPAKPDLHLVSTGAAPASNAPPADIAQLQRTLGMMLKENKALKDENKTLRDKLDQIKKIA